MDFQPTIFSIFSSNFRREAAKKKLAFFSSNFSEIKIFQQFSKTLKTTLLVSSVYSEGLGQGGNPGG